MDAPTRIPLRYEHPFSFSGNTAEYFKIWIINVCLSIITLGIYSAWAKVRTLRYFYGNTRVAGHAFNYTADPLRILKGRVLAVTALISYFALTNFYPRAALALFSFGVLLAPAIIVIAARFNLRNSTYRNIHFSMESDIFGAYKIFIKPLFVLLALSWAIYLLTENSQFVQGMEKATESEFHREDLFTTYFAFLLMPALPYLDYLRVRFLIDHTSWGDQKFHFEAGAWPFYYIYIIALLLVFALMFMMAAVGIVAGILVAYFGSGDVATAGASPDNPAAAGMLMFLAVILSSYLLMLFVGGYIRATRTNLIMDKTTIEDGRLASRIGAWRMGWIYFSNTVCILLSAGLLIPWATIRATKYIADCSFYEHVSVEDVASADGGGGSAVGEELVDAFDMDIGL